MITFVQSADMPFSATVDLQTRAIHLAYGLGSLTHFLEAARELLTCKRLLHSDFKRHQKKVRQFNPSSFWMILSASHTQIITLIEVY
jgi:hypothetical protein